MGFLHNLKKMIKTFEFNWKRFSFQLLYKVAPIVLLNKRVKSFNHTKLKIKQKKKHSKLNAQNPKFQKNNKANKNKKNTQNLIIQESNNIK
jgi:hypothetical protein